MAASELQPPSAQLAAQTVYEVGMLARAIVAVIDGEEDAEAFRFARIKAAMVTPNEALDRYVEQREAERQRALKHEAGPAWDAHPETRKAREELYRQLPPSAVA